LFDDVILYYLHVFSSKKINQMHFKLFELTGVI